VLELIWKNTHTQDNGVEFYRKSAVAMNVAGYWSLYGLGVSSWCTTFGEMSYLSLGYLLGLVMLPKSFYMSQVMVFGGVYVLMVGWQYCDIVNG
jgi:hypothetical protein